MFCRDESPLLLERFGICLAFATRLKPDLQAGRHCTRKILAVNENGGSSTQPSQSIAAISPAATTCPNLRTPNAQQEHTSEELSSILSISRTTLIMHHKFTDNQHDMRAAWCDNVRLQSGSDPVRSAPSQDPWAALRRPDAMPRQTDAGRRRGKIHIEDPWKNLGDSVPATGWVLVMLEFLCLQNHVHEQTHIT